VGFPHLFKGTPRAVPDNVYTGLGLRGVIPYVQCVAAVFLSQVCSQQGLQAGREREFIPRSRVVVYDREEI
jgi:hypothetical protein